MHSCWKYESEQRSNFCTLVNTIAEILAENAEYLTFSLSPTMAAGAANNTTADSTVISNRSKDLECDIASTTGSITSGIDLEQNSGLDDGGGYMHCWQGTRMLRVFMHIMTTAILRCSCNHFCIGLNN